MVSNQIRLGQRTFDTLILNLGYNTTSARAPDEATALLYVIFVCIYCWWPFEFPFEDRPTDQPTDRQTDL